MIGKLITAFFNFLLSIIMTIVQLICLPLNTIFNGVFPDFATKIADIQTGLDYAFEKLSWAVSLVPPMVREVILFVFTIELSMLVIMRSTHMTSKIWNILQKLKFW